MQRSGRRRVQSLAASKGLPSTPARVRYTSLRYAWTIVQSRATFPCPSLRTLHAAVNLCACSHAQVEISPKLVYRIVQQIIVILKRDFLVGEIEFAMGRVKTYFPSDFSPGRFVQEAKDNGGQPLSREWSQLHADYYEHFNYVFSAVSRHGGNMHGSDEIKRVVMEAMLTAQCRVAACCCFLPHLDAGTPDSVFSVNLLSISTQVLFLDA